MSLPPYMVFSNLSTYLSMLLGLLNLLLLSLTMFNVYVYLMNETLLCYYIYVTYIYSSFYITRHAFVMYIHSSFVHNLYLNNKSFNLKYSLAELRKQWKLLTINRKIHKTCDLRPDKFHAQLHLFYLQTYFHII